MSELDRSIQFERKLERELASFSRRLLPGDFVRLHDDDPLPGAICKVKYRCDNRINPFNKRYISHACMRCVYTLIPPPGSKVGWIIRDRRCFNLIKRPRP